MAKGVGIIGTITIMVRLNGNSAIDAFYIFSFFAYCRCMCFLSFHDAITYSKIHATAHSVNHNQIDLFPFGWICVTLSSNFITSAKTVQNNDNGGLKNDRTLKLFIVRPIVP